MRRGETDILFSCVVYFVHLSHDDSSRCDTIPHQLICEMCKILLYITVYIFYVLAPSDCNIHCKSVFKISDTTYSNVNVFSQSEPAVKIGYTGPE